MARLIYGFRISVLFGLALTIVSSVIGVAAGAVQGYFGGWTDLLFQRFIEIWTSIPSLYLLLIISSVLVPGFSCCSAYFCCFRGYRWSGWCARNFCAGATSNTSRPRGARRVERRDHLPSPVAERHGRDHDIPAIHPVVVGDDAHGARLPRLLFRQVRHRSASCCRKARRTCRRRGSVSPASSALL